MTDDERETAELLGKLKATPSAEARERAFAKLSQEFAGIQAEKAAASHGSAKRRPWLAAVAAGVVAVAGGTWAWRTATPALVAQVEAVEGAPTVRGNWFLSGYEPVAAGARVATGNSIGVGAGRGLLLRYSADLTVRFAGNTTAKIVAPDEIELLQGRVFVDATPGVDSPLRVLTPRGVVTHLGTQYIVAVEEDGVEVSVREGRAQFTANGAASVTEAGHWMRLSGKLPPIGGKIAEGDPRFDWIGTLPTEFRLQGATLADFMAWFRRETGLTPIYRPGVNEEDFARVKLEGSIDQLAPLEALSYVLATADLAWHREGYTIVIEKRGPGA